MIKNQNKIEPILKWAGGKRQLIPTIEAYLPIDFDNRKYYEPFLGGGALLFYLQPQNAIVNDTNHELINLYSVIKDNPSELIKELENFKNEEEMFYSIRSWDRDASYYSKLSDVEKAARIIYLNKTSYNGLYRVNSKGEYNTPFGKYKNPKIIDEEKILKINKYFVDSKIKLLSNDFEESLKLIENNSFVYFDPPYDPISETANFTSYTQNSFGKEEQIRLRDLCISLDKKGVKFLLSNSDTNFINEIYSCSNRFNIEKVVAKRMIGAKVENRKPVYEVLIKNY